MALCRLTILGRMREVASTREISSMGSESTMSKKNGWLEQYQQLLPHARAVIAGTSDNSNAVKNCLGFAELADVKDEAMLQLGISKEASQNSLVKHPPKAAMKTGSDLLATEMQAEATEAKLLYEGAIQIGRQHAAKAVAVAKILLDAKARLAHGQFGPWLRLAGISEKSERTAQRWMRLTLLADEKNLDLTGMTLEDAYESVGMTGNSKVKTDSLSDLNSRSQETGKRKSVADLLQISEKQKDAAQHVREAAGQPPWTIVIEADSIIVTFNYGCDPSPQMLYSALADPDLNDAIESRMKERDETLILVRKTLTK